MVTTLHGFSVISSGIRFRTGSLVAVLGAHPLASKAVTTHKVLYGVLIVPDQDFVTSRRATVRANVSSNSQLSERERGQSRRARVGSNGLIAGFGGRPRFLCSPFVILFRRLEVVES